LKDFANTAYHILIRIRVYIQFSGKDHFIFQVLLNPSFLLDKPLKYASICLLSVFLTVSQNRQLHVLIQIVSFL